jgi:hypothetical protein
MFKFHLELLLFFFFFNFNPILQISKLKQWGKKIKVKFKYFALSKILTRFRYSYLTRLEFKCYF